MDITDRLDESEATGCQGDCEGCLDWPLCIHLTPIEIHGPQCEEVYYDRHNNFGQHDSRDHSLQS